MGPRIRDRVVLAVIVAAIAAGDLAPGNLSQRIEQAIDVVVVVVEAEADPDQAGRTALVARRPLLPPTGRPRRVEGEQVGNVGVGAEAATAHPMPCS